MSALKTFRVGIICGSQRSPRVCDQITDFVSQVIKTQTTSDPPSSSFTFDHIDIAALNLPFFDEPNIPAKITERPAGYAHEHTRTWSARVECLDAFVFVTPQYNWGIPAGLKNAIDYLYHEWVGKPAVVVTYGGHGGTKCAEQMRMVLGGGLKMQVGERMVVNLTFPSREVVEKAFRGEDIGVREKDTQVWKTEQKLIVDAWTQMVGLLTSDGQGNVAP